MSRLSLAFVVAAAISAVVIAQQPPRGGVTAQEILKGLPADGSGWLTFGGNYANHRFSPLTQITPQNVNRLTPLWTFQTGTLGNFETTPLFRDNVLYVTGPQNVAWAIDARSGRQIWRYRRELPQGLTACCGLVNRGFGMLGDKLFMVTLDAFLLALDIKTGAIVWETKIDEYKNGFAATLAPLVVKDKVIVGVAGGDYGVRGYLDAYEAETGKRAWRYYTIPGPGEPGNETWAGDSWKTGGASIWVTGAYDPELDLVYFGTGNPGPDFHSESRKGDNLWSDSMIAVEAATGKMRWGFQFTPHDVHDWDATQVPVLADLTIGGQPRKVLMTANRNGFYYTLDRVTGKLIAAQPYVTTTWAKELDANGRPYVLPGHVPDEKGELTCPDVTGGTNFWPPTYDPAQRLFFVNARETCATFFGWKADYVPGELFTGGAIKRETKGAFGVFRALDPATGDKKWEFKLLDPATIGLMSTASGLLFGGDSHGNLLVLDSRSGKLLWRYQMGATMHGTSPITYMVDGRQQVVVPSGTTLTAWALPDVVRKPTD